MVAEVLRLDANQSNATGEPIERRNHALMSSVQRASHRKTLELLCKTCGYFMSGSDYYRAVPAAKLGPRNESRNNTVVHQHARWGGPSYI